MFSVAFEVLSTRTPHPAEPASSKQDGEGSSQFSDMIAELSNNCGPKGSGLNLTGLVSDGTDAKVAAGTSISLPKAAGASAALPKQADALAALLDSGGDGQACLQAPADDCPDPALPNEQPRAASPDTKVVAGKQVSPATVAIDPSANSCASTHGEDPGGDLEAEFMAASEGVKADSSGTESDDNKVCKRATSHDEKSTKGPLGVDADDQSDVQTDTSGISQPVATAITPVTAGATTPASKETTTDDGASVVSVAMPSTILAEKIGGEPSEKSGSGSDTKTQTLDTATVAADAEGPHNEPAADQISPELPPNITAAAHIVAQRAHGSHAALTKADSSPDAKSSSLPATSGMPGDPTAPQAKESGPQPQAAAAPSPTQTARADDIEKPATARQNVLSPDVFVAAKSSGTASSTDGAAALNGLPITSTVQLHDAGATGPTPQSAPAALVPVAGIAVEIASKALAGKNRFEIRLDPPELGRIHVRLDVDHSGEISSHLVVDRSDTLDLLRRDAPSLERALQDAGLKTTNNGLQFSLRDQGFGRHEQPAAFQSTARVVVPDDNVAPEVTPVGYRPLARLRSGLDIRI